MTGQLWCGGTRDVCLLANIHEPPTIHGNVIKPAVVANYNRYVGNVDKADRMVITYMASR
jgi:hypothetical protein